MGLIPDLNLVLIKSIKWFKYKLPKKSNCGYHRKVNSVLKNSQVFKINVYKHFIGILTTVLTTIYLWKGGIQWEKARILFFIKIIKLTKLKKKTLKNPAFKPISEGLTVARQKGLEPLTYCLEGSCSIQLSYWRIFWKISRKYPRNLNKSAFILYWLVHNLSRPFFKKVQIEKFILYLSLPYGFYVV